MCFELALLNWNLSLGKALHEQGDNLPSPKKVNALCSHRECRSIHKVWRGTVLSYTVGLPGSLGMGRGWGCGFH